MGGRKGKDITSPGKITRPVVSGIFDRERLFTLLDGGKDRPVTWVSGPAGSGKTTFVASYIDARDLPCLWYQVDGGDKDVATFFYYMGMAAKKAAPRKRKALPLLAPEYLADLSTFSRSYFDELSSLLPRPFVIVFDNYQEAPEDSPFHDVIRDGLSVLPAGINIISLSRGKIPPAMMRLQASGSIASIGWDDMQFTRDESAELLRLRGCDRLSEEDFDDLQERTQGWAAGLVLMTETARAAGGILSAHRDLGRQEVFDYFAGEILDKTDAGTREFLLKTAFLPKISVPVAEQLTDSPRADQILSGLNRNNYFTERHASGAAVYQYHPLFREFLISRAKASCTLDQITVIQMAAAALLEEDDQIEDAAGLYVHAKEWEGLVRLVQKHARSLVNQGRGRTLEEWLGSVPDDIMVKNPWLCYWLGICRMTHDLGASRESLEQAFARFKELRDSAGLFLSWSGIIDTYVYEWSAFRPLDRWIREIEGLLQEYPVFPTREIEARVTSGMFCALMYRQPHHKDLPRWEERAKRIVLTTNDIQLRMAISSHLIFYYTWWSGEQAKAATLVNALRPAAQVSIVDPLSLIVWRAIEAAYHWMAGHNEDCLDAVDKGLHLAESTGVHLWDFMLSAQASFGTLTAGDLEAAAPYLRNMASITKTNRRVDIAHYHYHLAWEALCRCDLALARENAQAAYTVVSETGTPFIHAFLAMGVAEVLIELGEFGRAGKYLDEAREMGVHMNSNTVAYQHAWLASLLCLEQEDEAGAREHLRRHLAVSKEYGILNHSWWRSSVMARLYAKALEAGIEVDHVQNLIRKRKVMAGVIPPGNDLWPWPLRIHTLGRFGVEREGELLRFPGKAPQKPLAMLKLLIASGSRGMGELQISDALWPDADGDAAHSAFTTTLQRLRKLIGEQSLLLQAGQLSLDPRSCWADAWEFESMISDAEQGGRGGPKTGPLSSRYRVTPSPFHRPLERAVSLYRGDFLAGEEIDRSMIPYREYLRVRFHKCIRRLADVHEQEGRWNEALDLYRRGLDVDDLAEEFTQRLMHCCKMLGRRAEGIAAYNRCVAALSSKLGIQPSPETEAIYESMRDA